jgi:hypothetical protein
MDETLALAKTRLTITGYRNLGIAHKYFDLDLAGGSINIQSITLGGLLVQISSHVNT